MLTACRWIDFDLVAFLVEASCAINLVETKGMLGSASFSPERVCSILLATSLACICRNVSDDSSILCSSLPQFKEKLLSV
jgi:hypothetical protein